MEKQRILHQFIQRTGLELEAAESILSQTEWDLVESYRMFDNLVKLGRIKPLYPPNASRMGPPPPPVECGQVFVRGHPAFVGGLARTNGGRVPYGPSGHFGGVGTGYGSPSVQRQPVERIIPIQVEKQRPVQYQTPAGKVQAPGVPAHRMQTPGSPSMSNRMQTPGSPSMTQRTYNPGSQPMVSRPLSDVGPQYRGHSDPATGAQQFRGAIETMSGPGVQQARALFQQQTTPTISTSNTGKPDCVGTGLVSSGRGFVAVGKSTAPSGKIGETISNSQQRVGQGDNVKLSQMTPGNSQEIKGPYDRDVSKAHGVTKVTRPASEIITSTNRSAGGESRLMGGTANKQVSGMSQVKSNGSTVVPSSDEKKDNSNHLQTTSAKQQPSSPRPLKRGFSKIVENEFLVNETRNSLLHDIEEDSHDHMYVQTFILPDLTVYSADFRAFLEKDLIETSTLVSLEQAGRLNWWAEMGICQRLMPMATSGDGNCLLHAASLAMWGIHDRELMLRRALHEQLTRPGLCERLYNRWRWQQTQQNKESGLIFSEEEWQQEWNGILKLASSMPRSLPGMSRRSSSCCDSPLTQGGSNPVVYESLEEFHVFVLAHVLQRPVIVVADTMLKDSSGDALAPIPFGGVYLPLECDPKSCYRSPLLLTYDAAHFSALVPMEKQNSPRDDKCLPVAVPLVGPDLQLIPLHFVVDPGPSYDWTKTNNTVSVNLRSSPEDKINMLQQYLDMEKLPVTSWDDNDSDIDRRSTGSCESDDNLGCIGKDKKKESKMSQQLQSMTKQFGSLGKSMGKKLRKNFGSVGKALKSMGPDSKKISIGSGLTQSTKVPLTIAAMTDQELMYIWCAKICVKQTDMHKKMIVNYMKASDERFQEDRKLMRARGEEIRRRSIGHYAETEQLSKCVTVGCNMYGNPDTSYLCSKCYSEQKHAQQVIEKGKQAPNMLPHSKEDPIQKCGKSKFYLSPDDDLEDDAFLPPSRPTSQLPPSGRPPSQVLNQQNVNRPTSQTSSRPPSQLVTQRCPSPSGNKNGQKLHVDTSQAYPSRLGISKERTPSPDYDNVEYKLIQKNIQQSPALKPKVQNKELNVRTGSETKACRTPGCAFFGVEATEFYCSACYKNKLSKDNQKTRL